MTSSLPTPLDLLVIGSGTGALGCALRCRAAGWHVAVVDRLPFGGTCALRGCDPKKMLMSGTEALDWASRMQGRGVDLRQGRIDWPSLMGFKRSFTEPVPEKREASLRQAGVRVIHGAARFESPDTVRAGADVLRPRFVHIAAGARPADLEFPGEGHVLTSTEFLELPGLPGRIAFIGGGYISFEFAHMAARAGAQAVILHRGPRPLAGFDPDLVDILVQHTREQGIEVHLLADVCEVKREADAVVVSARTPERIHAWKVDACVHGAGRVPAIGSLGLAEGNVAVAPKGITVNAFLQSTSNPRVYAAGDCADTAGPPLTPVASLEGRLAARNMIEGNVEAVAYPPIPSIVFTMPPLASVGLGARHAEERGIGVHVRFGRTDEWFSTRRVAAGHSAYKVLLAKDSGRIVGAHVLGPGAEEQINLFALAMSAGLTGADLKRTVFAYPTFASDLGYMV